MSKRYTIVLADRQTGTVRRFTIRLRPFAHRAVSPSWPSPFSSGSVSG